MEKGIAIEVKNLKKHFKGKRGIDEIKSVDGISFRVEFGEFFGLLGTNGAGKPGSVNHEVYGQIECKSGRRSKVHCDVYCLEMRMKEIAPEDEIVIIEFVERIQ